MAVMPSVETPRCWPRRMPYPERMALLAARARVWAGSPVLDTVLADLNADRQHRDTALFLAVVAGHGPGGPPALTDADSAVSCRALGAWIRLGASSWRTGSRGFRRTRGTCAGGCLANGVTTRCCLRGWLGTRVRRCGSVRPRSRWPHGYPMSGRRSSIGTSTPRTSASPKPRSAPWRGPARRTPHCRSCWHIGDDRARVAVYAAGRVAGFLPPSRLGEILAAVLETGKVTSIRGSARLAGSVARPDGEAAQA
jgi:hypothetical protein